MWFLLPLLVGALSGFAAGTIIAVVEDFLDEENVAAFVRKNLAAAVKENLAAAGKEAFKALIKERTKYSINFGILDKNDEQLGDMELKASQGVSPNLREGMTIYL